MPLVVVLRVPGHIGGRIGADRNHLPSGIPSGAQGRAHQSPGNAAAADRTRHVRVSDGHDITGNHIVEHRMLTLDFGSESVGRNVVVNCGHASAPEDVREHVAAEAAAPEAAAGAVEAVDAEAAAPEAAAAAAGAAVAAGAEAAAAGAAVAEARGGVASGVLAARSSERRSSYRGVLVPRLPLR